MAPHIMLHELGVPFEPRHLSFARGDHKDPAYLAINPEGKVPTLLIEGKPLTEVAGILFYLARTFPQAGLLPTNDPEAEARIVSFSIGAALNPDLRVVLIDDGEKLDKASMKHLAQLAADKDMQVWIERVGDGDAGAVIIEDGEVKPTLSDEV